MSRPAVSYDVRGGGCLSSARLAATRHERNDSGGPNAISRQDLIGPRGEAVGDRDGHGRSRARGRYGLGEQPVPIAHAVGQDEPQRRGRDRAGIDGRESSQSLGGP